MSKQFKELPAWTFNVREVSAGVFKAYGSDSSGRNLEFTGMDPETLLEKCKLAAIELAAKTLPSN